MNTTWTPDLLRECRNRGVVRLLSMSLKSVFLIDQTFGEHPDQVEYYTESGWQPCKGRFKFMLVDTFAYRIRPTYNPLRSEVAGRETQQEHETQGATK